LGSLVTHVPIHFQFKQIFGGKHREIFRVPVSNVSYSDNDNKPAAPIACLTCMPPPNTWRPLAFIVLGWAL